MIYWIIGIEKKKIIQYFFLVPDKYPKYNNFAENPRKFLEIFPGIFQWKIRRKCRWDLRFSREFFGKGSLVRNSWDERFTVAMVWPGFEIFFLWLFRGISCNPFQGISCNPFRGISCNSFWGIFCNPFRAISHNQFQGISLENNWRKFRENLGNFQKQVLEPIPGNFLRTLPKIFQRIPQKYLEIFAANSWLNSLIRT